MSVVAWDGMILACDRQITESNIACEGRKMFFHGGAACAIVGDYAAGLALKDWYLYSGHDDDWPSGIPGLEDVSLVVLDDQGVAEYYKVPIRQYVYTENYAWGSGRDLAMGAMAIGANASEAVSVASSLHNECGFGVDMHIMED